MSKAAKSHGLLLLISIPQSLLCAWEFSFTESIFMMARSSLETDRAYREPEPKITGARRKPEKLSRHRCHVDCNNTEGCYCFWRQAPGDA